MIVQDTSVFAPDSPQARAIERLFYFDLAIAAVIFAAVAGLVIAAVVRFRYRPGAPLPRQDEGNPKLETAWTIIPALILTALFIGTWRTMVFVNPPLHGRKPGMVVTAHQWWWEFRYPHSGVVTANELHLPVRVTSLLEVRTADVIHDFWVPDLGAKVDAIPNHPNYLWTKPSQTGIFLGTCAEFCGNEHALMGIRVIVQEPAAFSAWIQSQLVVPATPTNGVAGAGAKLFLTRTCENCHTIAGTAAKGTFGPNLTHLADRETIGAGVITNGLTNLTAWIHNPDRFKPGIYMPNLHLTESEAHAIAVYLEGLR
ncbi:MAG: cytochrome c oxidase subunit II [Gammaproteobacteria bacterium]